MKIYFRSFHSSKSLFGRWSAIEDQKLLQRYEELGPAWTLLSLSIPSRSPVECRRRWLNITNSLADLSPEHQKLVYEDGYEFHNGRLIKIPQETIVASPFAKMAAAIKPVRFRSQRRLGGWTPMEKMAVRGGYEMYGARWQIIANSLQFRTGRQVRNMMLKRYTETNSKLILKNDPAN